MDKKEMRKEARQYFIPFLLGNNAISHKLSKRIYKKYKIICYILDTKQTLADIFDFSSRTLKLTKASNTVLTATELVYLSEQTPYTLPILVPCSEEYKRLTDEHRELLEASFVLSSKEELLNGYPLNIIP